MSKNYKNIKINSLPEREVEILGAIAAERMSALRDKALLKFKDSVEIPGFRKGNAPENLVAQKVGEFRLLEEAAEIALSEEYPNILEENKIDAIGRPEITITKIAPGNDLEFKAKTSLTPVIEIANYKKIAKEKNSEEIKKPEVTEKEIEETILNLRKNVAHQKMHENDDPHHHNHDHGEMKDEDLPPLDSNFLKMLGNFKDLDDLKSKIKENILLEKELKEKDKKRIEFLDKIIEKSKIELPKIIIETENDKILAQFKNDLSLSGVEFDRYLKSVKKSEGDLKAEWRDIATKRAKSQLILNTIAKKESISPEETAVKREMDHILSHNKDADRFRVRMYVENFMTNELVFQFLENQK